MEKYLPDTNICIFLLKGKYNLNVKLKQVGLQNCYVSEITLEELKFEAEYGNRVSENTEMVDCFAQELAIVPIFNSLNIYAKQKAPLRKSGKILDDFDLLIGATAIANNLIPVTENEKHLARMSKINMENWIIR